MKRVLPTYRVIFPTPAVLITTAGRAGHPNVCSSAETFMVSLKPPLMCTCLRPETYSNSLLHATGEWVINFPTADILWQVDYCGQVSGRDVDKFARTGLTPVPARHVRAPLIQECPVNVECRVREVASFGSHDLFVGEILAIHADEEVLDAEDRPDPRLMRVVSLCNREYWQPGIFLARQRFSQDTRPEEAPGVGERGSRNRTPGPNSIGSAPGARCHTAPLPKGDGWR